MKSNLLVLATTDNKIKIYCSETFGVYEAMPPHIQWMNEFLKKPHLICLVTKLWFQLLQFVVTVQLQKSCLLGSVSDESIMVVVKLSRVCVICVVWACAGSPIEGFVSGLQMAAAWEALTLSLSHTSHRAARWYVNKLTATICYCIRSF